jgi:hypothetical protein
MSPALIWCITQWLSGPGVILEALHAAQAELHETLTQVPAVAVSFPAGADTALPTEYLHLPVWLRTGQNPDITALQAALAAAGPDARAEISLDTTAQADLYADVRQQIIIHFSTLEAGADFIRQSAWIPAGLALGPEAEEEPGQLDYARIDEWLEVFNHRFGTDGYVSPHHG